jgi:IPT/TIG domain-containing protein/VCBS repeat protein
MAVFILLSGAASVRAATVTATWDANTESDIAGYKLSYGTQSGVYTTTIDTGNVTTFQLTLNPGNYYFAVQAYDTGGLTSAYSNEVFFAVTGGTPPSITSLTPSSGAVGASVTIAGANFGATQGTSTVKFNGTTAAATSWSATTIVVPVPAGATPGSVVVTVGGIATNGVAFTVVLPAPTGLTAARGSDRINLSWTGSAGAVNYNIKRGSCFGCETLFAAGITGTGYSDTTVVRGQRYFYVVSAVSLVGESANSNEVGTGFARAGDFDGDTASDMTVFRPSTGAWYTLRSSTRYATYSLVQWGFGTDKLVPADYDGDGIVDNAVFRPSTNMWYLLNSSTGNRTYTSLTFGASGDIPVPGDYDGDGKADVAVFRPSTATWYILRSSDGGVIIKTFGLSTDTPIVADYDGDGHADIAVFRPSNTTWYVLTSSSNFTGTMVMQAGLSTDILVPGDYDGDGRVDVAVFRPSTNTWYAWLSSGGVMTRTFGASGDTPIPADFDGDGKTDVAVFRPSTGTWYVWKSTDNGVIIQSWGLGTDVPINRRP